MTNLYSQYTSGTQLTAGVITGSSMGASGLNPIVDRLNSITTNNNLITGSLISGTTTSFIGNNIEAMGYVSGAGLDIMSSTIRSPDISGAGFSSHVYSGTYYHSLAGNAFYSSARNVDTKCGTATGPGWQSSFGNQYGYASVSLPQGAKVTAAVVYGSSTDSWFLERITLSSSSTSSMAGGGIGAEDTTVNNETIDNSTYAYYFGAMCDSGLDIYSARVTYTL